MASTSDAERLREEVKVCLMSCGDVRKAVDTAVAANTPDPLTRYTLYDAPDLHRSPFYKQRYRTVVTLGISDAVRRHAAFTVNNGEAMAILELAPNSQPPKSLFERIIADTHSMLVRFVRFFNSREQKKRYNEYAEKVGATLQATIGGRLDEMMVLGGFATAPEKQQRGYGTALAKHITAVADAQGRSMLLVSSNVANTGLYESLGFLTVGEFSVGEDNPTWTKPPVVVRIMVREPDVGAKTMGG